MKLHSYIRRICFFIAAFLVGVCSVGTYVCFAEPTILERYVTLDIGYTDEINDSSGTLYCAYQVDEGLDSQTYEEMGAALGFSYEYSSNKSVEVQDAYSRAISGGTDGTIRANCGETVTFSYSSENVYHSKTPPTNYSLETNVYYYLGQDNPFISQKGTGGDISIEIPSNPQKDTIVIDSTAYFDYNGQSYYGDSFSFVINITDYTEHKEVFTDAISDPGDDGGIPLPLAIIAGVGATVAGIAGAIASTVGSTESGTKDDGGQFIMKVYKEFGDTIIEGDSVNVYAHVVRVTDKGETEVPELTKNIQISCSDGVFDVSCQSALAGDYKGAWVSVAEGNEAIEGNIDFTFTGVGGTLTNHVKFKVKKREIKLYQNNIALPALDEDGACVGFSVEGMDPKKCKIEVSMSEGSSYEVDYIESENIPGTYFAVLADTNTKPGEPGTYSEQKLYFKATEGDKVAENSMPVYRVTPGLYIGAETLNCYRLIKKEATSKQVQDLEASDFSISHTEIAVTYLDYDMEAKSMFYRPVKAEIAFMPIGEQKSDKTIIDRLEGIGLEAKLKTSEDSVSIYDVACTKGWLEPPTRCMAKIIATADEEDKDGNPVHYEAEKEVLLQSQPLRERAIKTDEDYKIEEWMIEFRSSIYDMNIAIPLMDINALGGELAMLDLLQDSYDEHYGYDPILIAQIQYNVQKYIHDLQMDILKRRQNVLEDYAAAANADANSTAMIWAHSFKMVSDKYLDNWGGMALRMGLGFYTSGVSEVVFLGMDANKATVDYFDRTPMSARNSVDAVIAGSVPVVVSVAIQGTFMIVGAVIPPEVKASAKKWVIAKTGALMTPRVQNAIFALKDLKKRFASKLSSLKTLTYDPKSKCFLITEAAEQIDNVVAVGRSKALKSVSKTSSIARTQEGKLISALHDAANKRGSDQAGKFIKAVKSGDQAKIKAAYWEVKKDPMNTFAIEKLNVAGKTKDQILAGTKVTSNVRAVFNEMDDALLQNPAAKTIRKKAASMGIGSEDDIVLFKGTGNSSQDAIKGVKIGADTDVQIKVKTSSGGLRDLPSELNTQLIGEGYAGAAGLPAGSKAQIKQSLKSISVEAMHKGHGEAYFEVDKVLKGKAVKESSSIHNIGTRVEKIISGVKGGRQELRTLASKKGNFNRMLEESTNYANGKISFESLSADTKQALNCVKRMKDSMHQTNKTLKLDVGKDFKAQALGHKGSFSVENVEFAQKCEFTEQFSEYNMGLFLDDLAARGTTYEEQAMDMIMNAHRVNSLCKGVSESTVDAVTSRLQQAVIGGLNQKINSSNE